METLRKSGSNDCSPMLKTHSLKEPMPEPSIDDQNSPKEQQTEGRLFKLQHKISHVSQQNSKRRSCKGNTDLPNSSIGSFDDYGLMNKPWNQVGY